MWGFLTKALDKLDADHIIVYIGYLGMLAACWYLLTIIKRLGDSYHELSVQFSKMAENLRTLVNAAINSRNRD